jgi:hypothetical protein
LVPHEVHMQERDSYNDSEWERLCDRYDAAAQEAHLAMQAVREKIDAGTTPNLDELVRLENATAARNAIEREMQAIATTRR